MSEVVTTEAKKRMLSGIQPSGDLHLGNYLGAIKNWGARSDLYECFYFMADLHTITVRQNPADLRRRTLEQLALSRAPWGDWRWAFFPTAIRKPAGGGRGASGNNHRGAQSAPEVTLVLGSTAVAEASRQGLAPAALGQDSTTGTNLKPVFALK